LRHEHARERLRIHDATHTKRDPFDRMLVAQSAVEKLTIVTVDRVFAKYGATVAW